MAFTRSLCRRPRFTALPLRSFSLLTPTMVWPLYLMFFCASGFGACVGPVVYSKAITAWFDKERGFALGIATCGVGLGTLLLPGFAQFIITTLGWRTAYIGIGITTWVLAFGMIAIFIREPPGYLERVARRACCRALGTARSPSASRRASRHYRHAAILASRGHLSSRRNRQ